MCFASVLFSSFVLYAFMQLLKWFYLIKEAIKVNKPLEFIEAR